MTLLGRAELNIIYHVEVTQIKSEHDTDNHDDHDGVNNSIQQPGE
jgi:hypothetical protein